MDALSSSSREHYERIDEYHRCGPGEARSELLRGRGFCQHRGPTRTRPDRAEDWAITAEARAAACRPHPGRPSDLLHGPRFGRRVEALVHHALGGKRPGPLTGSFGTKNFN